MVTKAVKARILSKAVATLETGRMLGFSYARALERRKFARALFAALLWLS